MFVIVSHHSAVCVCMRVYVGGLISFASTVIFLFTLDVSGNKTVLCSRMVSHGISLPPYFTLNTQMLTVLTQFTSKWKSFQTFGSNSVLLLNS